MKPLSPRERKLVAIALAVAMLVVILAGVVMPISNGFADRATERERLLAQYAQNERLIARTVHLRKAAELQRARAAEFAVLAPDEEQGSELLKLRLEEALAKVGGELQSTEAGEIKPGWAGASATVVVSNDQLVAWITRLNNEPPYIAMSALTISADRAMNSNRLDLLDVKLEVTIPLAKTRNR